MKDRILRGWTFRRGLFVVVGVVVGVQSIIYREWIWTLGGVFLIAMGVFALGCVGGNCPVNVTPSKNKDKENITFEEVKNKKINKD